VPSGCARATASAAMTPPAPGLLSMMMDWPLVLEIWSARMRAMWSMLPPGGTEMIKRMFLPACDCAAFGIAIMTKLAIASAPIAEPRTLYKCTMHA